MASLSYSILFVTISCTSVLNAINCYDPCKQNDEHKQLFVFGDYLKQATGRVFDRRIVPDFIASYANMSSPPPFLEPGFVFTDGASFASAGAGALEIHEGVINLSIQYNNFLSLATSMRQILGYKEAKKILEKSVYLFSIGGNDYINYNMNNENATVSKQIEYVGSVMGSITSVLEKIYLMGGRKFAFQNVGPLGCLPKIKQISPTCECAQRYLTHARLHNKVLSAVLEELTNDLPEFKYAIFDYYKALLDRIANATKYGFKFGEIACCADGELHQRDCGEGSGTNPSDFVFFDGVHTTEKTNNQLAEMLWNGQPDVTGPYNVKKLFEL